MVPAVSVGFMQTQAIGTYATRTSAYTASDGGFLPPEGLSLPRYGGTVGSIIRTARTDGQRPMKQEFKQINCHRLTRVVGPPCAVNLAVGAGWGWAGAGESITALRPTQSGGWVLARACPWIGT